MKNWVLQRRFRGQHSMGWSLLVFGAWLAVSCGRHEGGDSSVPPGGTWLGFSVQRQDASANASPVCPPGGQAWTPAQGLLPPTPSQPVGTLPGSFRVDENGAALYTLQLEAPPGRGGVEPELSIQYNSDGANGLLGMGMALTGLSSITRCSSNYAQDGRLREVRYDTEDQFCLDGRRLVAVTGAYGGEGTEYRTVPNSFVQVISRASNPALGPDGFVVRTKDHRVLTYGFEAEASEGAAATLGPPSVAFASWGLRTASDGLGNYLLVRYQATFAPYPGDPTHRYTQEQRPVQIRYTGFDPALAAGSTSLKNPQLTPERTVFFGYDEVTRPDPLVRYSKGMLLVSNQRLRSITMLAPTSPTGPASTVRRYTLDYDTGPTGRKPPDPGTSLRCRWRVLAADSV